MTNVIQNNFGKTIKNIVFYLLCLYVLVDMINGFLLLSGHNFSISTLYKSILLILMFFSIGFSSKKYILITIFIIFSTISLLINQDTSAEVSLFKTLFKIVFCLVTFIYVSLYYKEDRKKIKSIILLNAFFLAINFLISFAGLGFYTYESQSGMKGLFYAGNELGTTFICFFTIFLLGSRKKTTQLMLTVFAIALSVLIGTKVAIFSVAAIFVVAIACSKGQIRVSRILPILALIVFAFFIFKDNIMSLRAIEYQIAKFEWQYQKYDNNFLNALMSGRISFLEMYVEKFNNGNPIINTLFGVGVVNDKIIESDFFDIFFNYGLIVFCFVLFFYLKILIKSFRNKTLLAFNILFFLIAIFAGHTLTNTTATLFFAIANINVFQFKKVKCERMEVKNGFSLNYR